MMMKRKRRSQQKKYQQLKRAHLLIYQILVMILALLPNLLPLLLLLVSSFTLNIIIIINNCNFNIYFDSFQADEEDAKKRSRSASSLKIAALQNSLKLNPAAMLGGAPKIVKKKEESDEEKDDDDWDDDDEDDDEEDKERKAKEKEKKEREKKEREEKEEKKEGPLEDVRKGRARAASGRRLPTRRPSARGTFIITIIKQSLLLLYYSCFINVIFMYSCPIYKLFFKFIFFLL